MKRGIILILCLILQSSALSVEFAGGTGEPNDPYQIATAEQLIAIGSDSNLLDKSFVLVADIDLDPNLPGGRIFKDALIAQDENDGVGGHTGSSFNGFFDGQGHTIANLHIEGKYGYDAGLFGSLSGLVKDLRLTDVVVSGSPCGAIAGFNHGTIFRCRVTGQVSGARNVGGLVGCNWDGSMMECEAQVQVIGDSEVGGMVGGGPGGTLVRCKVLAKVIGNSDVGGLIGRQSDDSVIECRATGIVTGSNNVGGLIGSYYETFIWKSSANCSVTADQTAGGLIGSARWSHGALIVDCYAQGSISGSIVGGLMGEGRDIRVINSYAACEVFPLEIENGELFIGGLIGDTLTRHWAPHTISCFWDTELSGITVSTGSDSLEIGTGLTTEQMLNEDVFRNAGWDFRHVWIISGGGYPKLQWEIEDENDL
jgi:hypothetical protein